MTPTHPHALVSLTVVALALAASACGSQESGSSDATAVAVDAADDSCAVEPATAPAGPVTFAVTNNGSQVTEFYLYAEDGVAIVGEVENIGPGISRDLTVSLDAGSYVTACKPGMSGDGIRGEFTATGSAGAAAAVDDARLVAAAAEYREWVGAEADQLLAGTREFAAAVEAGDVEAAKALYPTTRVHWERIEPVAESFGDLDPQMDARENDVEPGTPWTGWHRLEKDLWVDGLQPDSGELAAKLTSDTEDLVTRIAAVEFTADRVTNGAKELLDEVATGKVTGEEERYSRTDLYDFDANVAGARKAWEVVRDVVAGSSPELTEQLDTEFATLQEALDVHRAGDGWKGYDQLTQAEISTLAVRVEALSEPLATLTSALLAGAAPISGRS